MKKLLCIALFSIAIMANANNKKENVTSNFEAVKIEKILKSNSINLFDYSLELSQNSLAFFGCGEEGNEQYDKNIKAGLSHRDARAERRKFVRKCRNLPEGGWLSIALDVVKVVGPILK